MSLGEVTAPPPDEGIYGIPGVDVLRPVLPPIAGRPAASVGPSAWYQCGKPVIDRVLAVIALVVTIPLALAVAMVVRCTSRGPILFRQARVGRDGRHFTVLKFRTMRADAEARLRSLDLYDRYVASGYKLQGTDECRLTPVGRFLRRTSLDELPQLVNVLRGDMSFVGPRPVVPEELQCYGDLAHCYLGVRPGITGIWQVSGRSHIQFPARAELDLHYFDKRSLWLDLGILARTPLAVLRADGAY